jgi:uncharacterized protein (DUF433 family)
MRNEYDFSQASKNPYIIANEWHLCPSVESDPGLHSGAWVFRGTRVPISALFENLRDGLTVNEFVNLYPGVDLIDVTKVLQHAAKSAS